jgi:DNA repair exonuclease SbcCD ATPase subunit
MKIASISLKDFRAYEQAEIAFAQPLTVIRALNGKGKTSIQQAAELALTAHTDGTDPRGAGAQNKIRNGASKALIGVVLETSKGPINLKVQYGPGKTGRQAKIDPPEFERYMDATKERLSCVLNTRYFTGLRPKEQCDVLAGLVLPTQYDFDAKIKETAEIILGRFDWSRRPIAVIDEVYSLAYDARKTAKAALQAIYIPQQPAKPEYSSEHVQKELARLRREASTETTALKGGGGGDATVGRLEGELERATRSLADIRQRHEAAETRRTQIKTLEPAALAKHQKVAAGQRLFDELQAKIAELNNEIHAQRAAQDIYNDLKAEPFCPTCTQAITRDFIDGKIAEHVALENEAITAQANLLKEQQALGDIQKAVNAVLSHKQAEEQRKAIDLEIIALNQAIAEANATIRRLEASIEAAKANAAAPPDTSALDSLNEQIAVWEARLGPATNYEATLRQIEAQTKQQEVQKAIVADLETLCAYFGKDGIKAKLIQDNIEAFSATVNSVLQVWGFAAAFSFDPYEFLVAGDKGELPLSELSGGETFMFCAALQCAIAIHSKIKMVIIDEADTLVDQARAKLFGCVKGLLDSGQLDQAIILEASANTEFKARSGVGYYRVVDGKVENL